MTGVLIPLSYVHFANILSYWSIRPIKTALFYRYIDADLEPFIKVLQLPTLVVLLIGYNIVATKYSTKILCIYSFAPFLILYGISILSILLQEGLLIGMTFNSINSDISILDDKGLSLHRFVIWSFSVGVECAGPLLATVIWSSTTDIIGQPKIEDNKNKNKEFDTTTIYTILTLFSQLGCLLGSYISSHMSNKGLDKNLEIIVLVFSMLLTMIFMASSGFVLHSLLSDSCPINDHEYEGVNGLTDDYGNDALEKGLTDNNKKGIENGFVKRKEIEREEPTMKINPNNKTFNKINKMTSSRHILHFTLRLLSDATKGIWYIIEDPTGKGKGKHFVKYLLIISTLPEFYDVLLDFRLKTYLRSAVGDGSRFLHMYAKVGIFIAISSASVAIVMTLLDWLRSNKIIKKEIKGRGYNSIDNIDNNNNNNQIQGNDIDYGLFELGNEYNIKTDDSIPYTPRTLPCTPSSPYLPSPSSDIQLVDPTILNRMLVTLPILPIISGVVVVTCFLVYPDNLIALGFMTVLLKVCIYTAYNPNKEKLYIVTDRRVRFQSKSWIDICGTRIMSSFASLLFYFTGGTTITSIPPLDNMLTSDYIEGIIENREEDIDMLIPNSIAYVGPYIITAVSLVFCSVWLGSIYRACRIFSSRIISTDRSLEIE